MILSIPGASALLNALGAPPDLPPPEGPCGDVPLWRDDTLRRWVDLGCPPDLPASPSLQAFTVEDLAERMGVTVAAVRKWTLEERIAPTWRVHTTSTISTRPMLLWSPDDLYALLPDCPGGHKVEVARVESRPGARTKLMCSCRDAAWVELRVPQKAATA